MKLYGIEINEESADFWDEVISRLRGEEDFSKDLQVNIESVIRDMTRELYEKIVKSSEMKQFIEQVKSGQI